MNVYARTVAAAAQRTAATDAPAASPCISVCQMDEATGYCEGCLRTIDEIMDWGALDERSKRDIWQQLAQRAAAMIDG